MTTLADVAELLKRARLESDLSQDELAKRAGVARTTVARMETLARGDMSVSILVRLLAGAGYDLKTVRRGYVRTLEDILAEQRQGEDLELHAEARLRKRKGKSVGGGRSRGAKRPAARKRAR